MGLRRGQFCSVLIKMWIAILTSFFLQRSYIVIRLTHTLTDPSGDPLSNSNSGNS